MIPDSFLVQATAQATYQDNHTYVPSGDYPTAFSTGYVQYENVPKHMIPSYYIARYAPDTNNERVASEYPNTQNNVFDVFYTGINQSNARAMNANSVVAGSAVFAYSTPTVASTIGSMISPAVFGEFDSLGVVHPSLVYISIKFTGIANGAVDLAYTAVYGENFSVPQFIDLREGRLAKTFTHANKTYHVLDLEDGVLWRDDEDATGFYFLEYAFVGWGRNTTGSGLGNYSYLYPAIGCALDIPPIQYPESASKTPLWLLTGSYGSFPYGGFRRSSWGTGIRTRPSGSGILTGVYYEEEGTQRIFVADILNASYASFYCHGYIGNYAGFNASAPVVASASSLISTWTIETLRNYHDKWDDDQRNFYIPEGRGDFATTVPRVTLEDIWKHMCLLPVWATPSHEYEYAQLTEHFWFAAMDGNEYVGNLIRGDDPTLSDRVPTWITDGDSTLSLYNPDSDRPTPEPPSDDGEDDTRKRNDNTNTPVFDGIRLVSGTGFSTFYSLSSYHVTALGTYLSQMPASFWEALGTATDYKMANILDFISGFKWYPLNLQASAPSLYPDVVTNTIQFGFNGATSVALGDVGTSYKLGTVNRIFDFGTISIPYKDDTQTFLDSEPYTDVFANLPFIGMTHLHANQVLGYQISCHYVIDLITGMCTCFLDNGFDTIYTGCGKIGVDITVFGNDIITQSERLTAGYIGTATHAIGNTLSIGASASAADVTGIVGGATSAISGLVADTVQVANAKRGVPQSVGGGSGFGSTYCDPYPCIIVNRPAIKIPGGYGHQNGYVLNTRVRLGSLSGYTVCVNPDLTGITATTSEKSMIADLLQSGVYI